MRLGAPVFFAAFFLPFAAGRSLSVKLLDATYTGYHNSTSGLDVWLGVSWDHNGAYQFDPTPLINLSGNKFVAVVLQYRLGAFGFLSGSDIISQSNGLNAAITDARFALQFVQSNIGKFGGSKDDVTIWGQSSGGGTVLELLAQEGRLQETNGSKYRKLFRAAIMNSPWFPPLGKCSDTYFKARPVPAAPSSTLRQLNYQMNKAQQGHVNYWTACLEDNPSESGYLKIHPVQAMKSGIVAGATGSNSADGSAPSNLSTSALFQNFLRTNWPLTAEQISRVSELYPESAFTDSHARGVSVYQDAVFACGSTWATAAFTKRKGSWRYLFGILPAVHAQDNAYEFPIWYNYRSPVSPSVFAAFGGSIANFTVGRNPNSKALNNTWAQSSSGNQIVFNMTSPANISETYITDFYAPLSGTKERCDFWADVRLTGGW
ncbi:unnamed protein product [Rhizoctonia solani]|uniref:Carboxylic ester hydrolase n=1 Tax=Rhizoctonia solani TaxID=456999 RepID=A0A8H2XXC2_9AGAM|nr:unnamed protein product [Rhizoctonia solani]